MDRGYKDLKNNLSPKAKREGLHNNTTSLFMQLGPGGLMDVMLLMGYYEEELAVGLKRRTREVLGNLVRLDDYKQPRLAVSHYSQLVEPSNQKRFEEAKDVHREYKESSGRCYDEYCRRIRDAILNEFDVEVFGKRIKRKHQDKYEHHLNMYADIVKTFIENTGEPPQLGIGFFSHLDQSGRTLQIEEECPKPITEAIMTIDDADADVPNPSAPLSKKEAAAAWGGSMTVKKLTMLMKSGKIKYKELDRQTFIFCRDQIPNLPER